MRLSLVIPVHNEAEILEQSLQNMYQGLSSRFSIQDWEIVLVDNGSTDDTKQVSEHIVEDGKYGQNLKIVFLKDKGLGLAYKRGIAEARFNNVLLSAIDLPFGFSDLDQLIEMSTLPDVIFFSKTHRNSKVQRGFSRTLASLVLNSLLKLFFGVKIGDTQGSIYLNKEKTSQVVKQAKSSGLFFTAQLGIYATRFGIMYRELPIVMRCSDVARKSRFKLCRDGFNTFILVIKEYLS